MELYFALPIVEGTITAIRILANGSELAPFNRRLVGNGASLLLPAGGVPRFKMAKVIENKELKQRKANIKALKILIEQYVKNGKYKAIIQIKTEQ